MEKTKLDTVLSKLISVLNGYASVNDKEMEEIKEYSALLSEMSVTEKGLIFKAEKIMIPKSCNRD